MSVNFAGAKSLAERRRRRIVSENEIPTSPVNKKSPQAGYLKLVRFCPETKEPPRAPIASLVPEQAWKIWIGCFAIPFLLAGLYVGSLLFFAPLHSPASEIFHPEQGHAWRFLQGLLLLGSAGLCWLISWFRSASVKDFEGCFKSWYWSGWIFLLMGLLAGVDGHLVLSELIVKRVPFQISSLNYANFNTLVWAVPMLSLLSESMRCFVREMWHCRRSWIFLWGACLSTLVYFYAKIEGAHTHGLLTESSQLVLVSMTAVLSSGFLFCALFSQIHHVMYVSSDPVPKRQSWLIQQAICSFRFSFSLVKRLLISLLSVVSWGVGVASSGFLQIVSGRRQKKRSVAQKKGQPETSDSETVAKSRTRKSTATKTESKTEKTTSRKRRAKSTAPEVDSGSSENEVEETTAQAPVEPVEKPTRKPRIRVNTKPQPAKAPVSKTGTSDSKAKEIELDSQELEEYESHSSQRVSPVEPETIPVVQKNQSEQDEQNQEEDWENWQDSELDPELLRGLSKKEKKRLRKNHRDQMRAKAG